MWYAGDHCGPDAGDCWQMGLLSKILGNTNGEVNKPKLSKIHHLGNTNDLGHFRTNLQNHGMFETAGFYRGKQWVSHLEELPWPLWSYISQSLAYLEMLSISGWIVEPWFLSILVVSQHQPCIPGGLTYVDTYYLNLIYCHRTLHSELPASLQI